MLTRYAKPGSLEEALALLGEGTWRVLAGGTDFYPALGAGPLCEDVLDINGLDELEGISETEAHFVIGARTSWSAVIRRDLPPAFDMVKLAAREVGSIQIQNTGTVAGNLCNASPAADGVPPLMALDAEVELRSARSGRTLPLTRFVTGNRGTARKADELVTAVRVPKGAARGRSAFIKIGARRYLVISIAMVAARIALDGRGVVEDAAVAVGSCSAVAQRLWPLERALVGQPAGEALARTVAAHDFAELSPIDDARATAEYRHAAAREIVTRAVTDASGGAVGELAA